MSFELLNVIRSTKFRSMCIVFLSIVVAYIIIATTRGLLVRGPTVNLEEEIRVTTQEVGKLMELPAEKPMVATVKDVTQLPANQPFFLVAKNGDKVLFYNDAKKAILYRPSTDKIVNVAPITVNPTLLK